MKRPSKFNLTEENEHHNSFVQEKLKEKLITILGSPPKDVYWWYDSLGAEIELDFIYKIFPKKKVTLSWKRT
ncbi:hypothetical protein LCGC14_1378820 [marine sediment metagenome]|uniref:Uncharacterized protein n=1 Tax=marine sediment metagenome TaxID=412755 RepID=A0A0F9HSP4_9ZZZZ|nr:hypothetical protein [archaeon]